MLNKKIKKVIKTSVIASGFVILPVVSAQADVIAKGYNPTRTEAVSTTDRNWKQSNGRWQYFTTDGDYVINEWKKSGNQWFYLGDEGYMMTDALIEDGDYIYAVGKDGARLSNTWVYMQNEDGDFSWYYLQSSGRAKDNGFLTIDGKKYHFTDGKMDEISVQVGNYTYALNQEHDGSYGAVQDGWIYINDVDAENSDYEEEGWYYFGTNGKRVEGQEKKINGHYYAFDEQGLMLDQFVSYTDAEGKTVYKYYRPGVGDRIDGWYWIEAGDQDDIGMNVEEDAWFYFGSNGTMYSADYKTTKIADNIGVAKIKGEYYAFDENGAMQTDFIKGSDGQTYYFDLTSGKMKTGRVNISEDSDSDYADETFYFNKKGEAITGVENGYLYNGGQLMKAEDYRYEIKTVADHDYLVNKSGKVQKAGTYRDREQDVQFTVVKNADNTYNITITDID